ncbi:BlaI/MecI/CopY family transcriptional regulator [Intestinimonas massiliensis]|uniref:BlaI/MecI/CopY family transcriptional regulator n=1 Tax=Intestinimonas massiliensis (ex Afouda et al. 2020) TaxID=1673721 RepID=A0AAW5JFV7_9FIRM|nr:BlaI/MecI/CopY family transcriptional regulator [Intestinimonas massiliensis (ex Afouda et al. 2020)]MCQ4768896.1 BlaI/MecI/CopY family transcriptional regulator [Intestinimonas massiliensis (ex Afouda et al. 2020)]
MKRLPDTELEVMKALWASERAPVPRSSLEEALRDRGWATNTFNTYLSRLTEKGFVSCEKRGKTNYYTPQVRQADYLAFESGAVLNKVFGSSLKSFVASLARGGALRDGELDELQQYLEELKRGDRP